MTMTLDSKAHQFIVFPYSHAEQFMKPFLWTQMENKVCIRVDEEKSITFECNEGVISALGNFFLLFEGAAIKLKVKSIEGFKGKSKQLLLISFSKRVRTVILGTKYIRDFNQVLDEEDKTMGFPASIPSSSEKEETLVQ